MPFTSLRGSLARPASPTPARLAVRRSTAALRGEPVHLSQERIQRPPPAWGRHRPRIAPPSTAQAAPELALASEDAATALLREGESEQARPLLDQAIPIYERLGADRDLSRVNSILRLAGVRRGTWGPRKRAQFGWQSLTATELTVSGLVADGLTNPQIGERLFVSRRTVQTHLAHVFTKLDLTSRAQLAVEVTRRRRGPVSEPVR